MFIQQVIKSIRQLHPQDKLFPLGVFNKRRLDYFSQQDVWASDYKGWIFRYNIEQSQMQRDRYRQIQAYIEKEIFNRLDSLTLRDTESTTTDIRHDAKKETFGNVVWKS